MRRDDGFTLIEVMIALTILLVVTLGMATTTGRLLRNVATEERVAAAIQLAEHRIQQVQIEPAYGRLDTLYAGTESGLPGLPGATRETRVVRYGGPGQPFDYFKITVTVSAPGLLAPVKRTVTVGAP